MYNNDFEQSNSSCITLRLNSSEPTIADDNSETEIKQMEPEFSIQELKYIDTFAKEIDITDPQLVLQYGLSTQKKIATFSDSTLERVRTKDSGEIGNMLTELIDELKSFSTENTDFIGKSSWKVRRMISALQAQFSKVYANVTRIVNYLEEYQLILMQDMKILAKLEKRNQTYFKEISMYILAGKKRLALLRKTELPKLREAANTTFDPQVSQKYKDFENCCEKFEKKLYDLQLSRTISMQLASQINILQDIDSSLIDKIQSTIVNTIPLWKNQMIIALGIAHSVDAMKAQQATTAMTNSILSSNAKKLKKSAIEIAHETERGVVDVETLAQTNKMLIETITEVQQIQHDGRKKRQDAENELKLLENDIKRKLINS